MTVLDARVVLRHDLAFVVEMGDAIQIDEAGVVAPAQLVGGMNEHECAAFIVGVQPVDPEVVVFAESDIADGRHGGPLCFCVILGDLLDVADHDASGIDPTAHFRDDLVFLVLSQGREALNTLASQDVDQIPCRAARCRPQESAQYPPTPGFVAPCTNVLIRWRIACSVQYIKDWVFGATLGFLRLAGHGLGGIRGRHEFIETPPATCQIGVSCRCPTSRVASQNAVWRLDTKYFRSNNSHAGNM